MKKYIFIFSLIVTSGFQAAQLTEPSEPLKETTAQAWITSRKIWEENKLPDTLKPFVVLKTHNPANRTSNFQINEKQYNLLTTKTRENFDEKKANPNDSNILTLPNLVQLAHAVSNHLKGSEPVFTPPLAYKLSLPTLLLGTVFGMGASFKYSDSLLGKIFGSVATAALGITGARLRNNYYQKQLAPNQKTFAELNEIFSYQTFTEEKNHTYFIFKEGICFNLFKHDDRVGLYAKILEITGKNFVEPETLLPVKLR